MAERILIDLSLIIILGILAQWIAWRVHVPSIIFLLLFGFLIGPVANMLQPDQLFGPSLFPLVSLSVAIILFEGGLSLSFRELRGGENVLIRLISIGVLITFGLVTFLGMYLLQLPTEVAILLGAILVVTGPTVVVPLLVSLRIRGKINSLIYWEGIVNDPIGASLAVIVFEIVLNSGHAAFSIAISATLKTILIAGITSGLGAFILIYLIRRYWVPDYLHNPFTLMLLVIVFSLSNHFQAEAGLLAVTLMGIILANQKQIPVRHILEFKENLRVILISALFIILASRLSLQDIPWNNPQAYLFLAALIFVVRPVAVLASSIGSDLNWRERVLLFWMAPRGIVAAAVSSIFGLELVEHGIMQGNLLMSYTFMAIIGTVLFYGITARPVARALKLAHPNPQGIIFVGAHRWARILARYLRQQHFDVLLIDTNKRNISYCKRDHIPAILGNALDENLPEKIDITPYGKLAAVTSNDEVNSLACMHYSEFFGKSGVFQVASEDPDAESAIAPWRGRTLFCGECTFDFLETHLHSDKSLQEVFISEDTPWEQFQAEQKKNLIPLFVITEENELIVWGTDNPPIPSTGDRVVYILTD